MKNRHIDDRLKVGNFADLLGSDSFLRTPAGLVVPAYAAETFIKSEAKKLAAASQPDQRPFLFSKHAMYQNMAVYGAREKPRGTPQFWELREAARRSFIDSILIRARTDQSKMVWQKAVEGKQVGFKVVHEQYDDPKFRPTDDILRRCKEMEELVGDPTPQRFAGLCPYGKRTHDGLKDLVARLVQAELILDRKVINRVKRADGKGYAFFHWVPGDTIKPVHEALREWANKHPDDPNKPKADPTKRTVDRMSRMTGFDMWASDYVQMINGEVVAAFKADELSIHIANPSDEIDRQGYGESRLELSLDVTATLLMAWNYNKEMFKTNYPESIIGVSGNFNKEGLEAFKQHIYGDSGLGGNWRLPIISSGEGADVEDFKLTSFKLRDAPKDMLFDQLFRMLVAIKCAAYGAHPSIVNFTVDSGSGGGGIFGHDPKSEIEFSKEHGFLPALMDMASWLTEAIIKPRYDDLRLIIVGLDEGDEKERQEIFLNELKNFTTRNEARIARMKEPKGFFLSDEDYKGASPEDQAKHDGNPWNYPNDAAMPTYLTSLAAKQQMEQQAEMGGEDPNGQPGEEDDADSPHQDDDNPWGTGAYSQPDPEAPPEEPVKKSEEEREVKYLRISIQ